MLENDNANQAPQRGFPNLRCLHCNEPNTLCVDLENLVIRCASCEAEDTPQEIQHLINRWSDVLDWILQAPLV